MIALVLSLLPGALLIATTLGLGAVAVLAGDALWRSSDPAAPTLEITDDAGVMHRVAELP